MKYIKTIVDRVNLLNRKGLGAYYSPDQISAEVNTESLNLWKKYVKEFEATQIISVFLEPFRDKETVTLTSGAGTLATSNNRYKTGVMLPTTFVKVTQVDIAHWSDTVNDPVRVPSAEYPICRIDNAAILVRPTSVTSVEVHFIKRPTKYVYAFDEVDGDYVYNDTDSVDAEWPEEILDEITNRVLGNLGFSQREGETVQYSNVEQAKEGK